MNDPKYFEVALAEQQQPVRAIYIASYPPRRCGIATFTKDLTSAINNVNPEALAEIIAMNDSGQDYDYPWEVKLRIRQHTKADYMMAAKYINQSSADIVCLQHEFGLFGGPEGDFSTCLSAGGQVPQSILRQRHLSSQNYLLDMLEKIDKPVITTFHSILLEPNAQQMYMMRSIIERSSACVAMTNHSRQVLIDVYGCPAEKAVVIYHGVPDFTFNDVLKHRQKLHIKASPMILCAGLLGPGKGLEYVIEAMPAIVNRLPEAKLYIVGQTHPVILRSEGEQYRESLAELAKKLKVSRQVRFVNEYLDADELRRYFQATDFFITAYKALDQSGSGTLAWALGAGKVSLSTPYHYAKEVLAKDTGILINPGSSSEISENIMSIFNNHELMAELSKRAYAMGRKFSWPIVGLSYLNLFRLVLRSSSLETAEAILKRTMLYSH